ncbi:hypothetical protein SADUNF_Sadunf16G0210700 [Salix dunnii]|uniref:Uncharacterized protein n=1 Tax=Salix dunnii TaxID=1413687 RepID=A0A835JB43_9ROSI|nr:hypothetical protein SADUNF_Sadunf16G0210700 [Salix dunnii]
MIPHIFSSQNVAGASSQQHKRGNRMVEKMPDTMQFKEKTGIPSATNAKFKRDGGTRDPSYGEDDQVIVDIDSLTSSIERMMPQNLIMSDKCCIFRVPAILRRHRECAYKPNAFSIGPWHRYHPQTEIIKLNYLKNLLSRESKSGVTLKELVESTRKIEKEARWCYEGRIRFGVEDFVRLLVIDGCFLIELFRKGNDYSLREKDDPIFNTAYLMQCLYHDLILVENQIPWLVLEHLFNKTCAKPSTKAKEKTLAQLALQFFDDTFSYNPPNTDILYDRKKHLLDLLRYWLIQSSGNDDVGSTWEPIPSATDLVDAGIKLKVVDSQERSLLDIKFNNGSLEIPSLLIHETTEVVIRNLISYEQCYPQCNDRITSYAVLLDNLINTTKDMDILTSSGIITNWLNPEEAMQFFNKLYHDACLKNYYYQKLCHDVKEYSRLSNCSYTFNKLLGSAPVAVILKLPWSIFSNVLGFGSVKQPDSLSESQSTCSSIDQPPLVEEITIPSVTQLCKCGVRFVPSNVGISTIYLDKKTCTFYIPTISLDVNSDVVLRNLVAYEASNATGPMVFTRYTDWINGIIDTSEDAKIIRERGIILNHYLKNDEEVANIWNGMSSSIRLTKVPFLDKVIGDVIKYHDGLLKLRLENS